MRNVSGLLLAPVFALALLGPAPARAELEPGLSQRLRETWIPRRTGTIVIGENRDEPASPDDARFAELLSVMRADRDTNALLLDVTRKLGFARPEDLRPLVLLCDARTVIHIGGEDRPYEQDEMQRGTSGHVVARFRTHRRHLSPGSPAPSWEAERAALAPGAVARAVTTPLEERLSILEAPTICLRRQDRLFEAFQTFVHELTHLQGILNHLAASDDPGAPDVLAYADADAYAEAEIAHAGGEMDAFAAETRAIRRLERAEGLRRVAVSNVDRFFDEQGQLKDRDAFRRALLDENRYRERLREEFRGFVRYEAIRVDHEIGALTRNTIPWLERMGERPGYPEYRARARAELERLRARQAELQRRFGPITADGEE